MKRSTKKGLCMTLCITIIMVLGNTMISSATGNLWYDKYVSLDSEIGGDYYANPYSDVLGWSESYIMESYIDMYNLTGNTSWLDKIVTHADTMIANANDNDSDGYLGWDTAKYSPLSIENTGFETLNANDSTLPDKWIRYSGTTSATAYSCTTPKYAGSRAVTLNTNSTNWINLYQDIPSYTPGGKYQLRVWGCTNGSEAKGRAYVRDRTDNGRVLGSIEINTTDWQYYYVDFTAPAAAGHDLEVFLSHMNYRITGGSAYFDEVKVSERFPFIVHDGKICLPIAKFIKLVSTVPALQSAYGTKANSYRSFIENEIVPRWESSSYLGNCWVSSGSSEGYYIFPAGLDTYVNNNPGDIVPYNMMLVYAHMLMTMYDVNNNATYLDRASRINTYFRNDLTANGTAYKWNYAPTVTTLEDTSHGCIDLGSALDLFRHDSLIFSGSDMEKFTDALTEYMWNKSVAAPTVTQFVDGTGSTAKYTRNLAYWTELSQFDWNVWWVAANQFRDYTPTAPMDMEVLSQIMLWDPQKIVNQGFELKTSFDSTQPARWNRSSGTMSAYVYVDSANKYSGNYGLTVKANGTSAQQLFLTLKDWSATTQYELTFDGCTDGTAAGGKVIVKDDTTGVTVAQYSFSNTQWQRMSFTFTSTANTADNLRVYLTNNNYSSSNGKAYFDNIKIKKPGDTW